MAHTPGPWKAEQETEIDAWVVNDANGRIIADADWASVDRSEVIANSHLIAAAPDMIEMLKKCQEHFKMTPEQERLVDQCVLRPYPIIAEIDAVIAKTRGE